MRVGQGWDIHRMEENRRLVIGGVEIPSAYGSVAHSDGDVLIHAVIDAILGASAAGDIGTHFPDTAPEWENADSLKLLAAALKIAEEHGMKPVNIDSTVILQTPKLKPYINAMCLNIARAAGIETAAVSVKAKTNEGLGETGSGKAVEAQAVVLMEPV